jgi:hypothetical protein
VGLSVAAAPRPPEPARRRPPATALAAALAAALALGLPVLTGCAAAKPSPQRSSPASPAPATASFTDSGVTVTLRLGPWHAGSSVLTAVFAPVRAGFHLYSTALPANGVDGVGRPTAIRVSGALAAQGQLTAHATTHALTLAGSTKPVPVYPDGPVTATLTIRHQSVGQAVVQVSYAACSVREGCLFPVSDHPVRLDVTDTGATFTTAP